MKKSTIITALTAIMIMAVTPAFAQEENGFKKFNVREDFTENGFQWFQDAELLAAGDKEKSNAMTIGWGGIGTLKFLADSYEFECEGECLATWKFFYEGGGDVGEFKSYQITARDGSHVLVENKYVNYEYDV